jgi:hypothetical protein
MKLYFLNINLLSVYIWFTWFTFERKREMTNVNLVYIFVTLCKPITV